MSNGRRLEPLRNPALVQNNFKISAFAIIAWLL
jgi:hypothetical protein